MIFLNATAVRGKNQEDLAQEFEMPRGQESGRLILFSALY